VIDREYPEGIDCVWLASDSRGSVAAFVTAGVGPIPVSALNHQRFSMCDTEKLINDLPVVSGVQLLISVKRPDDFVAIAERGLFVYDWRDAHRTEREATRVYELVAIPEKPIEVRALSELLAGLASVVKLGDEISVGAPELDVCADAACSRGAEV